MNWKGYNITGELAIGIFCEGVKLFVNSALTDNGCNVNIIFVMAVEQTERRFGILLKGTGDSPMVYYIYNPVMWWKYLVVPWHGNNYIYYQKLIAMLLK